MADLFNQDDEQQKPDVTAYLAKKYNLAGDYQKALDDTSTVDAAKEKAASLQRGSDFGGALDLAFGGGKSQDYYADLSKKAGTVVKDAQATKRQNLADTVQMGKLQQDDDKATRDSQAYADDNDPNSDASKSLRSFIKQVSPKLGQGPEFEKASYSQLSKVYPQLISAHEAAEGRVAAAKESAANRAVQRETASEARAERESRVTANDLDGKVSKYAANLEKTGIPGAMAAVSDVDRLLPAPGEDVPGFGRVVGAMPDMLVSRDGEKVRQAVNTLFNITLKDRSGAAVTDTELNRLKDEFGSGTWKTDAQLRDGIAQYKRRLREVAKNQLAGTDEGAVQEYVKRGGNDFGRIMSGWDSGGTKQTADAGKLNKAVEKARAIVAEGPTNAKYQQAVQILQDAGESEMAAAPK